MKLLTFVHENRRKAGALLPDGVAPIEGFRDVLEIIRAGEIPRPSSKVLPLEAVRPVLPYEVPPKIWCIGLNYLSHAEDIHAVQPEEPGSFMKPASRKVAPAAECALLA